MSKIRLHGSSSGYMEIAPPAAASSATITLPNSAGEVLLSDGSAASLTQIPAANIVGVCTAGLGNASGAFTQGKVLQVVQNVTHTRFETTSSTYAATAHTVTITPTAASSKILVNFIVTVNSNGTNHRIFLDVYRSVAGGTAAGIAPQGSSNTTGSSTSSGFFGSVRADNSRLQAPMNLQYLDTPSYSLGNSIVYTLYARSGTGDTVEVPGSNQQEPAINMATEIAS